MACANTLANVRTYNDTGTYGENRAAEFLTYGDPSTAVIGYGTLVDGTTSRGVNRGSLSLTHTSSNLFVVYSVLPVIELGPSIFTGFESIVDISSAAMTSVSLTHTSANEFVVDTINPQIIARSNVFTGFESIVDGNCAEAVSIRLEHTSANEFVIDTINPKLNLRSARQPAT